MIPTSLVDIVLTDTYLLLIRGRPERRVFAHGPKAFRQDHEFVARDLVGSDGLCYDPLRFPV